MCSLSSVCRVLPGLLVSLCRNRGGGSCRLPKGCTVLLGVAAYYEPGVFVSLTGITGAGYLRYLSMFTAFIILFERRLPPPTTAAAVVCTVAGVCVAAVVPYFVAYLSQFGHHSRRQKISWYNNRRYSYPQNKTITHRTYHPTSERTSPTQPHTTHTSMNNQG